jgi:hypothetical protein
MSSVPSTFGSVPGEGSHEAPPIAAAVCSPRPEVPKHAAASYNAFLRDLPELLASHRGGCAAYEDGVRQGIGRRSREFFQTMYDKGCDPQRLLFFVIEPQEPMEVELLTPEL